MGLKQCNTVEFRVITGQDILVFTLKWVHVVLLYFLYIDEIIYSFNIFGGRENNRMQHLDVAHEILISLLTFSLPFLLRFKAFCFVHQLIYW